MVIGIAIGLDDQKLITFEQTAPTLGNIYSSKVDARTTTLVELRGCVHSLTHSENLLFHNTLIVVLVCIKVCIMES